MLYRTIQVLTSEQVRSTLASNTCHGLREKPFKASNPVLVFGPQNSCMPRPSNHLVLQEELREFVKVHLHVPLISKKGFLEQSQRFVCTNVASGELQIAKNSIVYIRCRKVLGLAATLSVNRPVH